MSMNVTGLKVFSATKYQERDVLGERVTEWIRARPNLEIEDIVIRQSSDSEYHCLSITVLFGERKKSGPGTEPK